MCLYIVNDILESLHTIELYEDLDYTKSDSDLDDPTYGESDYFDSDDPDCMQRYSNLFGSTSTNISFPQLDGPSTAPLGTPYMRQPNDAFHDNDPYMYYEASRYPEDTDYYDAIGTLRRIDERIYNRWEYEELQFDLLHHYINEKLFNIDFKLPKRDWRAIKLHYEDLQRLHESVSHEQNRLYDVQDMMDEWD